MSSVLKPFDPWKNSLCTCPIKRSLNPYTGCPHGCLYCYAISYIPRFSSCRPKADLLRRLGRDRLEPGCLVSLSNSSDPYPPVERDLKLTRGCLEILREKGARIQVVTKSDIVCRDADILGQMPSVVSITLTTLDESLSRRLEPGAPLPKRRLSAMEDLRSKGVPVAVRLDPIIPFINAQEIGNLVDAACSAGASHVTTSTYKARPDNMRMIYLEFPDQAGALKSLFSQGKRMGGSLYLPGEVRRMAMEAVAGACRKAGVTFSACREGMQDMFGAIPCDGSHMAVILQRGPV
jgi:DNA repair photolyase